MKIGLALITFASIPTTAPTNYSDSYYHTYSTIKEYPSHDTFDGDCYLNGFQAILQHSCSKADSPSGKNVVDAVFINKSWAKKEYTTEGNIVSYYMNLQFGFEYGDGGPSHTETHYGIGFVVNIDSLKNSPTVCLYTYTKSLIDPTTSAKRDELNIYFDYVNDGYSLPHLSMVVRLIGMSPDNSFDASDLAVDYNLVSWFFGK